MIMTHLNPLDGGLHAPQLPLACAPIQAVRLSHHLHIIFELVSVKIRDEKIEASQ